MTEHASNSYASIIEQVARLLKGEPNSQHSKADDLRFGTHGSLSVKPSTGQWHDHEANVGGGTLDLVQHLGAATSRADAHQWLVTQGLTSDAAPTTTQHPTANKSADTVYQYRAADGSLLYEVVRKPGKKFMQRRPDPKGHGGWAWNLKGVERVLYRLPELLAASLDETVYIVEGEKDADRLASLHLVATCNSGGAGKWAQTQNMHLKDRAVILLPDNDQPGREHAALVAKSLTGVAASITVLALPGLPEKGDVSDWLDTGHTIAELMDLATKQSAITDQATGDSDTRQRQSQTDVIVAYVQARFHLVHDSSKTPYAVGREDGICSRLQGRAFRDAVLSGFFRTHSTAVRDAAWREALMTLCAVARDGKPRTVHLRVADLGEDEHVIDLGEPDNGRCVILRPGRWEVHAKAPVLFVRPEGMEPLPIPVSGGSIQALWECANIPKNARLMVVAWLIEAMRESTPYPGIELVGEQGSGKSFTAKLLRRLIDPNACDLRGAPRSVEDIFVSGGVSHVLTFENLTHLHSNIQDALCIASTGGGHARRTLYTDADETVIQMKRPWIVNGISVAITQQDLIDRTLSIDLPVIEARNASTDLWRHFVRHQASIIGAVLDIAAKALALMPEMPPLPHDERPRLIEFANLGRSVAVALGDAPENFMTQFNAARSEAVARVLDGSPVASAILDWVGANPLGREQPVKAWMHDLEHYRPLGAEAWPKSPKGLGDAMRRAAPALRQMGIECKCLGKIGGAVKWEIKQKLPSISASPANATGLNNAALDQDIRTCRTSSEQLLSVKSAKTPDSLASENAPASSTAPDKQEVFLMNATQLLKELYAAGIFPEIVDGGRIAIPAGAITDAQRQAIKRHKQELLALL